MRVRAFARAGDSFYFTPRVVIFSRVKGLIKFSLLFLVSEGNFSDDILSFALFAPRSV